MGTAARRVLFWGSDLHSELRQLCKTCLKIFPDFCNNRRGCWCPGLQDLVLWYGLPTHELGRLSISICTLEAADSAQ
ncbi:hypothetical protein AV530_017359 [Patagioenas fasciata monilis]|uniref:Uncharacterized protein n=1 Tax=Patagioenas fasciata monilis TaxID=372326 RepID=A0A1V4JFX1_PATFA|nr:hypothetical protein AV530_017359 [Patagioenas fasciata monilis]